MQEKFHPIFSYANGPVIRQLDQVLSTELGQLVKMTYFYLDSNSLSSSIPTELGQMTKMSYYFSLHR